MDKFQTDEIISFDHNLHLVRFCHNERNFTNWKKLNK